jgi:hypothetical protein
MPTTLRVGLACGCVTSHVQEVILFHFLQIAERKSSVQNLRRHTCLVKSLLLCL